MVHRNLFQFLIVYVFFNTNAEAKSYTEYYIWRDYDGIIPADALANGFDKNDRLIYIGQVLFENKLIPGKIVDKDDNIYFEWYDKEKSTNENVKILCTWHAHKFVWIDTRHNEVHRLSDKILIKGGYEPNYSTYIGRIFENGETNIGKVICSANDCFGLYTTKNGVAKLYQVFEILTYDPKMPDVVLD